MCIRDSDNIVSLLCCYYADNHIISNNSKKNSTEKIKRKFPCITCTHVQARARTCVYSKYNILTIHTENYLLDKYIKKAQNSSLTNKFIIQNVYSACSIKMLHTVVQKGIFYPSFNNKFNNNKTNITRNQDFLLCN